MAEENGTYVNRDRRIQRYNQAKSQPGMARPAWWVAGEVIAGPGPSAAAPATAAEAFELLGERWPVFAGTSYDDIGFTGRVLGESAGRGRQPAVAGRGCRDPGDEGLPAAQRHQDAGGLHRDHGGRGAADPDGAEGQRLDAEPARPQPGRAGRPAAAGGRRAQEHPQGRNLSRRWPTGGSSCWRRPSRSFRRCCSSP